VHEPPPDGLQAARGRTTPAPLVATPLVMGAPLGAVGLALALTFGALGAGATAAAEPAAAAAIAPTARAGEPHPPLLPAFAASPLDSPLIVTGSFGERRPRHFHAGLDFSTGGSIGHAVRAPMDGWIERIRTQGVGYGRSLYLRTRDDRLVVLAHLDAFAGALGEFIAAAQESSGHYEQDLWAKRSRFPVKTGDLLAFSGRSGTGEPHLHVEVRVGDTGINPLRAGFPVVEPMAPRVPSVTLEPLDEGSWVERGAAPITLPLAAARADTVVVEGRVRVLVQATEPGLRRSNLAPWRVRATWGDEWVEWRADSASWVTDMVDVDYVYDTGRAVRPGSIAFQLWAPPGFRPRLLRATAPESLAAGSFAVAPGEPARPLRIDAEDLSGHLTERVVWLRGPRADEQGGKALGSLRLERSTAGGRRRARRAASRGFAFADLPARRVRVSYSGAPADVRAARIAGRDATRRGAIWSAILDTHETGDRLRAVIEGTRAGGGAWSDSAAPYEIAREQGATPRAAALEWSLEKDALFERDAVLVGTAPRSVRGTAELVPLGPACELGPATLPLRSGIRLRLPAAGPLAARAGLYGDFGSGWEWLGGAPAAGGDEVTASSRRLGWFAALADTMAPRVRVFRPLRRAPHGPYSTWELRARVLEFGSGVDADGSAFIVDGRRVPSEWDAVRELLRWKPLAAPARGAHRWEIEVRDHAGNVRRGHGTFVLD
jgi:murein DD-endopeptidase MepM/ murein hydrolase activator NlpD